MEPVIENAIVYYNATNHKQLRAHIECQVPNNCSLTTVGFVAVNNNLARATFAVTQCSGTATSLTLMDADANITLAADYTVNHQTEFVLLFDGDEKKETISARDYKEE